MLAVVLAAGRGERLRPLTLTRPKVLLEVGGKPILSFILEALREVGIKEAILVVNYMEEAIRTWLGDGSKFGLEVSYVRQEELRGTADAIASALRAVGGEEEVLVVYGDLFITEGALRPVIEEHRSHKPLATMGVVEVERPCEFGMVRTGEGWLRDLVEKPSKWPYRPLANTGIYVLSNEALEAMKEATPSERGELEATDVLRKLAQEGDTVRVAEVSPSDWLDVGRPWDLLEANERALSRLKPKILGRVEAGAHIVGPVVVEENARIRSGAYIEGPTYIGPGSDIGPNCYIRPCTSIGRGVRIGNACEVKNSIVMEGTHIGHLSYVGDSIIGAYCNLGAGTITANLRFDKANIRMVLKGRVVDTGRRKMGVIMGDLVQTGIGVLTMPGVRIWPRCWIGPNVVVYKDVAEEGSFVLLEQSLALRSVPGAGEGAREAQGP